MHPDLLIKKSLVGEYPFTKCFTPIIGSNKCFLILFLLLGLFGYLGIGVYCACAVASLCGTFNQINNITAMTINGDQSPDSVVDLTDPDEVFLMDPIDRERCRFPFCIVWTPIPVLTWIFPFLGHMGICTSSGVIRDFAGPYFVSEDLMAFGNPTKYWQLTPKRATHGQTGWDSAVAEASEIYKKRMHILFYDNCHSHVATALNIMSYNGCKNWNMVKLAFYMIPYSKYVSIGGFLKTWVPFLIIVALIIGLAAII